MSAVDDAVTTERPPGPSAASVARRERLRLLVRSKTFLAGAVIVGFWVLCAIFGSAVVPKDPFALELLGKLKGPSGAHWFGTDQLGRDVFARVIVGARDILIVAPLATLLGTVLGAALGLVTGYFRGAVDDVLSRVIDAFLAVPVVIVGLLALVALGPSRLTVVAVIGIVFTPIIARTVRAAVLSERELDYVDAARLRNERAPYILFAEILPNVAAPDPGRVHRPSRVRDLRDRDAQLPRVRHPTPVAGLGAADLRELQPDQRGVLVDDAVPGARDREPGRRRQPASPTA